MAWTDKYVSSSAAGGGDGSSGNPWTLAEGITNEAAGQRINVLAGTYASTTTNRTWAATGTTTAPIWWRGFKTSIGDQDSNNVAVAGTDIPSLTVTTGQFSCTGAHHIFSNLDFSGATVAASGLFLANGTAWEAYRCRFTNTATNTGGRALTCGGAATFGSLVACYLKVAPATGTTADMVFRGAASGFQVLGCQFTGGTIGVNVENSMAILSSIFDTQGGDAIKVISGGSGTICGNSIYSPTGHGINVSVLPSTFLLIANNYFENVNQAGKVAITNTTGTNTNLIRAVANAYYNCTANTSGFGDSPLIFDNGTLGSAGFVDPSNQNFAINPVLRALGFPGLFENTSVFQGYLDPGAVQRQEPSASPVVIRPFPGLGALLTM